MNIIRQLAFLCFLVVIFALPLEDAVTVGGIPVLKLAWFLATGMAVLMVLAGEQVYLSSGFLFMVLLYVIWLMLSFLWTEMPVAYETPSLVDAPQGIKNALYVLMFVLLCFQMVREPDDLKPVYAAALCGGLFLAYLMLSTYQVNADTIRHEIKGFEGNEVTVKFAMLLPLSLILLRPENPLPYRLLALAYIPLAILGILITGSRTGAVLMVLGLAGGVSLLAKSSLFTRIVFVVGVILVFVFAIGFIPEKTISRIFTIGQEVSSGSFNERGTIWKNAIEAWLSSPFYGHGLESFSRTINQFNVNHTAHNSYISLLVSQGLIGLLLYLGVIASALLALKGVRREQRLLLFMMLLIVLVGQLSLELQRYFYVWFAYTLLALNHYLWKSESGYAGRLAVSS